MRSPSPTPPEPVRVAIVLSHATQYYSPWFRWMRANTPSCFRVFYLSDAGLTPSHDEKFQQTFAWDVDLRTGYDWEVVPNRAHQPDTLRFAGLWNPELTQRLTAWRPDAILLFGYRYRTHLWLIAWARLRRIPLIFRGDSHLLGRERLASSQRWLLPSVYRQFAACTYVGKANRTYFQRFGVADRKLFFAPHAVDAARFDPVQPQVVAAAHALRAQLGAAPHTRIILFAGKLIAEKQPVALLRAFLKVRPTDAMLVFVGDGPEKPALHAILAEHPDAPVRLLPFANQSEMPARYLMADLFVLPSRGSYETWGLAVNEAMHMGVPCLVSDRVGCQQDLVSDRVTGWVFPADDPLALASKLQTALNELANERARIQAAVHERISKYTYAQTTRGFLDALAFATRTPRLETV